METIQQLLVHNPYRWYKPLTHLAAQIRRSTGGWYNHTGFKIKIDETWYVIEAVWPRVHLIAYDEWLAKDSERDFIAMPVQSMYDELQTRKNALGEVGKPYDLWSLVCDYIYLRWGVWIGRTGEAAKHKDTCYETVANACGYREAYRAMPKR